MLPFKFRTAAKSIEGAVYLKTWELLNNKFEASYECTVLFEEGSNRGELCFPTISTM